MMASSAKTSTMAAFGSGAFIPGSSSPNRIAAVSGSNKGIGFYIALQLTLSGLFSNIILGCRDPSRGEKAVQDIRKLSPTSSTVVSYLPLNLGDEESHVKFQSNIESSYGRLDVLVNNAAMAFKGADPTPFHEQTKPTLDVNFRGTIDLTTRLLPLLRKGRDARIVNVASMAGRLHQIRSPELRDAFVAADLSLSQIRRLVDDFERDVRSGEHLAKGWGNSNYGMSKLAVIAATRVLARDEKGVVAVNCCCPGYCDTDMTSHKGPRPAEEGAKNAVLLATMEDCPTGMFYQNMAPSEW